jgi:NAD(P)-dependent dehydrogenase (short-subunit alcohol dehydrogenase family)
MRPKDKVTMVTGAAHGMGKVKARLFAKEGAKVVSTEPAPRCRPPNMSNSHNGCEVQP